MDWDYRMSSQICQVLIKERKQKVHIALVWQLYRHLNASIDSCPQRSSPTLLLTFSPCSFLPGTEHSLRVPLTVSSMALILQNAYRCQSPGCLVWNAALTLILFWIEPMKSSGEQHWNDSSEVTSDYTLMSHSPVDSWSWTDTCKSQRQTPHWIRFFPSHKNPQMLTCLISESLMLKIIWLHIPSHSWN